MKKQAGFTLIELVMVIVILGILAATALPKFANLQGNANYAKMAATLGAMKSAATIVHSQAVINGVENDATSTIVLEGVNIATVKGYPTVESILIVAGDIILSDFDVSLSTPGHQLFLGLGSCVIAYLPPGSPQNLAGKTATASAPYFLDLPSGTSSC